ncbi:23S rRNA (guanosine(2251)-2'-O)-methyltransferase RlmB [Mycoplasmopsis primatum]|uniref:23S rRNA (guanosine(2251)-2'-O)-methyltransferase RlmB n=1 Tax=Mycoplasmopsis primatum TaxID=55604 RepID=UPI000497F57E|nr:23S rRNA (guanosine(2251)-2'-O)-methyltransferase RlmB [Mycoplasmopsis primatum]
MKELYLCGRNTVIDAIKANLPIKVVYVLSSSHYSKIKEFSKIKVVVKDAVFFKEFDNNNHQGYIAFLKDFPIYDLETIKRDKPNKVLVLDHIQDSHNLGAIIRTSNASGFVHIILPKDRSADITPTVLKVSSGGFINIKIIKVANIAFAIDKLKQWGYWIYGSALDEKAQIYSNVIYNKPCVLIVGNEEKGISQHVLKSCDEKIYIPQFGTVQSLNVSVATGILMYEIIKNDK